MQVAANGVRREHEQPMSWARALLLAVGFFFLAAILIAQVPGYFYTISTLANLARFEQGTLALGLLAVGFGIVAMEVSMLYDPRPLLPPFLFAGAGVVLIAVGAFLTYMVTWGGWQEFLPNATVHNGGATTYWPIPGQSYLFSPIWFQPGSIDIGAVGMIAAIIGLGMFAFAVLCRPVLSGRLDGAGGTLIVRLALAVSIAILAVYITVYTFAPQVFLDITSTPVTGTAGGIVGNILLFLALASALFAVAAWLLPIMVRHRQQFMPAVYLHGVIGLLGSIGVPLLILWAVIYPLVYGIHQLDTTQFFVECSQKANIPGSCTFTPYTGYIITALVVGLTFQLFALAIYFWSTRRNTVILGVVFGLAYVGIAGSVIHVDDPAQLPLGLFLATGIALLAYFFAWASQRDFGVERAEALGCTGQWLVLGTGMFIYLTGFSLFSFPSFFESEALGLNYSPGAFLIHDAFWGALLMGGLAAMQFILLTRRQPMSQLRKFIMWTLLVAVALMMVGAIQGFHTDLLAGGWNVAEGSHAVFVAGICFEVVGLVAALFGAGIRAASLKWFLVVLIPALVGAAGAWIAYNAPGNWAEIVVFFFIFCTVGAFLYAVAGPDWSYATVPAAEQQNLALGTHE